MSLYASANDIEPALFEQLNNVKVKARRSNIAAFLPLAVREMLPLIETRLNRSNQRHFFHVLECVFNTYATTALPSNALSVLPLFDAAVLHLRLFSPGFASRLRVYRDNVAATAAKHSLVPVPLADSAATTTATATATTAVAEAPPTSSAVNMRASLLGGGRLAAAANQRQALLTGSLAHRRQQEGSTAAVPSSNSHIHSVQQQQPPQQQQQQQPPPQQQPVSKTKRSFAMSRYPFKRWSPTFVLAPVQLNHADGIGTFSFDFVVTDAHWVLLQTPPLEAAIAPHQLRLVVFTDECHGAYSVTPPREGLALHVNEHLVVPPEYSNVDPCERFYGTDITAFLRVGKNTLSVAIDKCMCMYRFGVRQVDQFGDHALTQLVVQRCQLGDADAAYAAARAKLVASFVSNTDVVLQETAIRASLHDPVTLVRLRIPARGTVCTHAQCFDLPSYISFQRSDVRFLCPVCQQRVLFEDLVIDPFFARVLDEIGPRVDDVCIFPDGTVKPLEVAASPRRATRRALPSNVVSQSHAAKRSRTTAGDAGAAAVGDEHDNDDDDADDAFFARLKQQIEKPTDVIDLT